MREMVLFMVPKLMSNCLMRLVENISAALVSWISSCLLGSTCSIEQKRSNRQKKTVILRERHRIKIRKIKGNNLLLNRLSNSGKKKVKKSHINSIIVKQIITISIIDKKRKKLFNKCKQVNFILLRICKDRPP